MESPQRRRSQDRRRDDFGPRFRRGCHLRPGYKARLLLLPYPDIKPEIFSIGPFAVRWYALAYIAGLVIGWQIMRRVCTQPPKVLSPEKIDDFLLWAALGVILGGRLGYVLFYKPGFFLENPGQILMLWEGGMSFHGGLLGVITAILAFS